MAPVGQQEDQASPQDLLNALRRKVPKLRAGGINLLGTFQPKGPVGPMGPVMGFTPEEDKERIKSEKEVGEAQQREAEAYRAAHAPPALRQRRA